jgi:flagellar hook-length control protein FliK
MISDVLARVLVAPAATVAASAGPASAPAETHTAEPAAFAGLLDALAVELPVDAPLAETTVAEPADGQGPSAGPTTLPGENHAQSSPFAPPPALPLFTMLDPLLPPLRLPVQIESGTALQPSHQGTPLPALAPALPTAPAQVRDPLAMLPQSPAPPAPSVIPAAADHALPSFPDAVVDVSRMTAGTTITLPAGGPENLNVIAPAHAALHVVVTTASAVTPAQPLTLPAGATVAADAADSLGQQVQWLVAQGRQEARIQLRPESLGHVNIRVRVEGDQAQLLFVVDQPHARAQVQAALPQLAHLFAAQGLQVTLAEVRTDTPSDGRSGGAPWQPPAEAADFAPETDKPLDQGRAHRLHQGLLDQYA